MGRLLRINDIDVDIDEKTAIGIDLQSRDLKDPGKSFINVSNTFSVPRTSNNLAIFGNPDNPQSLSTKVYEKSYCDYWINNEKLIDQARVRVESVKERINLFIFQKKDIWETLKTVYFSDFLPDYIQWLQDTKGLYSVIFPFSGQWSDFVEEFANSTEDLVLPMTWSNLYSQPLADNTNVFIERETTGASPVIGMYLYNEYVDTDGETRDSQGGHFCIYAKSIFEYIEDTYNVNFLTDSSASGNIWDDPVASQIYIDAKEIKLNVFFITPNYNVSFTTYADGDKYLPHTEIRDKSDKTLYDFVLSFMQLFNLIKDDIEVDGAPAIRLARFEDLETVADVEEFSDRITGKSLYKPYVQGYGQNNYIKFKTIYEGGGDLLNSRNVVSLNENTDEVKDLFQIEGHVPAVVPNESDADSYLDLSKTEAFETFTFMASDGETTGDIFVIWYKEGEVTNAITSLKLPKAALFSIENEYDYFEEVMQYPITYEIRKWLTITDIINLEFFKQYYVRELNGSFFINKISGFNPLKSKQPTTIELIKLGNRTPITPPDLDYWTDGVNDGFVDGTFDYWY